MKTLKELLFERRRGAEPDLDIVRAKFLARLDALPVPPPSAFDLLRQFVLPLRWHLAGLSAAWLLVLLLSIDTSSVPVADIAKEKIPPPRQLLADLREYRREILELTTPPAIEPALLPPRRSERELATAIG